MPRLGEMFLSLGYATAATAGAKLISFTFGLLFITSSFLLFRRFLSRSFSLLATITLYSFPAVAWLSSSAYIDLTRATFETASLLSLIIYAKTRHHKYLLFSSLLLGFTLSTKIIALPFLPIYLLIVYLIARSFKKLAIFFSLALLPALPWYLDNLLNTGNPVYPILTSQLPLNTIATSAPSPLTQLFLNRLLTLPTLPYFITYQPTSLLTPLFLALLPLFLLANRTFWTKYHLLAIFTILYSLIWWFLPYRDSRYLLPAFSTLFCLLFLAASHLQAKYKFVFRLVLFTALTSIFINFTIRFGASLKYFPLFLGRQTPTQYINQQKDGNIDDKLNLFYSDYWKNYRYP